MALPHRPLTERELADWERWSGRDITWKGEDVARLLAMIRGLQTRVAELEGRLEARGEGGAESA